MAEAITLRWALFIVVGLCLTGTALSRVVAAGSLDGSKPEARY